MKNNVNAVLHFVSPKPKLKLILKPRRFKFDTWSKQRAFMNTLFMKLKLQSLEQWIEIPKFKIVRHGGKSLVNYYYSNDKFKLLARIYPNYPWNFPDIDYLRAKLSLLFQKLNLQTFEDWYTLCIPSTYKLLKCSGDPKLITILNQHKNIESLLLSAFPNYDWENEKYQTQNKQKRDDNNTVESQRRFMDDLFVKLNFTSNEDWFSLSKHKFLQNGGYNILKHYNMDYNRLLSALFPNNYPYSQHSINLHSNSDYHQRKFMDKLFIKYKFTTLDQLLSLSKRQINRNSGSKILKLYSNNLLTLLTTVYPNYPFVNILEIVNYQKLKVFKDSYQISQKKDWYRISNSSSCKIINLLKQRYPNEVWCSQLYTNRNKKVKQRILVIALKQLFPRYLLLEDYRQTSCFEGLEFDIFIPSLNMAIEYQGVQHYNDTPAHFSYLEAYKQHDITKIHFSSQHSLYLYLIPYWWNCDLSSLFSFVLPSFNRKLSNK